MSSFGVSFGVLSNFDHLTQEWTSYKSRLQQWYIANDITDETDKLKVKRRAILISAFTGPTYMLARDLALPKKLEETDYEDILKLLDCHFEPKRLGFAEKSVFYSALQRPDESHTQWAARIRGLTAYCGFKNLEEALLDKFIMGMIPGRERDKLFTQDQADLTLAKAVDLAESVRSARRATLAAPVPAVPHSSAAVVGDDDISVFVVKEKCSVCGYSNHKSNQCRFRSYKCKKCNNKGHLKRMCTSVTKVNRVEQGKLDNEEDDGRLCFNIRSEMGRPMVASVNVGGLVLEFEIDSGSAVSIISEETYCMHFEKVPLSSTNKKLFSYTGEQLETKGFITLEVKYSKKMRKLILFVVSNGGPSLLGRDFISKFDLELAPTIKSIRELNKDIMINDLITKFPTVFSSKLGKFNKYAVELHLKPDSKPIFFKARAVPYALKNKIDEEIDRLIELGVLEPVQYSDYASPIVPVLKKDGGVRICADFSITINKQLIIEKYPLPSVNDLFAKLYGGVQFSKLDLSMAYNQFCLKEQSQGITCINTHRGLFKYTRLVFGLSSAPAIFQRAMECILSGLDGVVLFLDDILITGVDNKQHLSRLVAVLDRLADAGLTIQRNKCEFFKNEVNYLGHIIDKKGIRKSPEKVAAVTLAPRPQNVSQLQSFLGLTNYYRNFVPNASSILAPLYNLLEKKSKWEWTQAHENAFRQIKQKMLSDKVLAHFDPSAKLILTVDASPYGLGAVLSQIGSDRCERPISYASRTLSAAEKKYAQIQKEATAIIFGVRRFHQYLYARTVPFILRTDHKPLITIFGPYRGIPEVSANRLQRYAIFLSAYNYIIEYVSSKNNNADYLSRAPVLNESSQSGCAIIDAGSGDCDASAGGGRNHLTPAADDCASYVHFVVDGGLPVTLSDLQRETAIDKTLSIVVKYVLLGWPRKVQDDNLKPYFHCRNQLSLEKGCLMRGHKVIIPESLRNKICNELHSSHFGVVKMKAEARKRLWFPGVDCALEQLARACAICSALRPAPPHAPLAPWPHPPHAFYRIHLDFLGPFNNQMFLIAVDAYSKWVEVFIMNSSYGSKSVIEKLIDLMSRVGIPQTLVTDNGTSFISQEFKDFCLRNGIKHILSPVYHPASNGQAESFVKIIKKGLKSIIISNSNKKPLKEQICKFLFDYRNSRNSTTEKSPAELVYGRPMRSRLDLLVPVASTASPLLSSSAYLAQTVERNQCLQEKHYRGKARKEFKEQDLVWITRNFTNKKYVWIEGIIKKKIGNVIYEIYIPEMDRLVKRHVDQIRAHGKPQSENYESWDSDVIPDIQNNIADSNQTSQDNDRASFNDSDLVVIDTPPSAHSPSNDSTTAVEEEEEDCGLERHANFATPEAGSDSSFDVQSTPMPAINPRRLELSPDNFTP